MWSLIFAFAISGVNPHCENALVALPFDLQMGQQSVSLRKPLINRMSGARLILFTRASPGENNIDGSLAGFQDGVPLGSIKATVSTANNESQGLVHTGYSYYKGAKGVVLTLADESATTALFTDIEIDSTVSMKDVKAVWIDRGGLDVRDLAPSL